VEETGEVNEESIPLPTTNYFGLIFLDGLPWVGFMSFLELQTTCITICVLYNLNIMKYKSGLNSEPKFLHLSNKRLSHVSILFLLVCWKTSYTGNTLFMEWYLSQEYCYFFSKWLSINQSQALLRIYLALNIIFNCCLLIAA